MSPHLTSTRSLKGTNSTLSHTSMPLIVAYNVVPLSFASTWIRNKSAGS